MRKLLLKVHLYSGLVCFWYLLILGTSSLDFNHEFSFMSTEPAAEQTKIWEKEILITESSGDDLLLSHSIRDSLALIGWPLPWETWRDSTGRLHFAVHHPGKRYVIDYDFGNHIASVAETPRGGWQIFNAMHGMGAVPGSAFMHAWKWYSRITVVLVIFSIFTGIYLWYRSSRDLKTGLYVLMGSLLISLAWMLQLYFQG